MATREKQGRALPRGDMTLSEAVRTIRDCDPEVRPAIYSLLREMGLDVPEMVPLHVGSAKVFPKDRAKFSKWFREAYQKQGMKYEDVAEALGTSRVQVYRWGHGTFPQEKNLRVILDFFGYFDEEE